MNCTIPPYDWQCSRKPGHTGPCAAFKRRASLRERIRVAWQNWRVRKTGRAMRQLSKDLQDPGYRQVWHANLVECIYRTSNSERVNSASRAADDILKHFFNV